MADSGKRLDSEVVERGLVSTRSRARDLIRSGAVRLNGAVVTKAAQKVTPTDTIAVVELYAGHVGRGARKLLAALDGFDIDVSSRVALDVGASTGGFTQTLLQRGVAKVHAVDVGTGQLARVLREDPKVMVYEGTDIRTLDHRRLVPTPDFVVVDVSFISTRLVVPAISDALAPRAEGVVLVKPQFEVGPRALDGRGVVRDTTAQLEAVQAVSRAFVEHQWRFRAVRPSAVVGAQGNQEYFIWLERTELAEMGDGTWPTIDTIAAQVLGD